MVKSTVENPLDKLKRIDQMLEVQEILNEMDQVNSQACRQSEYNSRDQFKDQKLSYYQQLIDEQKDENGNVNLFVNQKVTLDWP